MYEVATNVMKGYTAHRKLLPEEQNGLFLGKTLQRYFVSSKTNHFPSSR